MNRGRRGEEIFAGKNDYAAFIDLLKELGENYNIKIAAYSLISNHYHLLLQTPGANISRAMRHLNGVYTQRFNRIHNCDGQLFRLFLNSCKGHRRLKAASILDHYSENVKKVVPQNIHFFIDL